jgi:hypothetical protein
MKKFMVKFESTDWCGYWDNFIVLANDTATVEEVEMNEIVVNTSEEWLHDSVTVDNIYVDGDEDGELDYEAMDAEVGTVTIKVSEWLEEDDGYIEQYDVIDLRTK